MKISLTENALWKGLFFSIILFYCLFYAPFGVNETDGGFLTGLAWQVLNGKMLYQDIIYVRPPLPVWLRALELLCLPDHFEILGERWLFFGKVGLYSWLGAALLVSGSRRWMLAVFGFVISAHCYPPMAWHTIDGILFAVLAAYLFFKSGNNAFSGVALITGGAFLVASMMCKQSFYPLVLIYGICFWVYDPRKALLFFCGSLLAASCFITYLWHYELFGSFLSMTNGATEGGQAFQHGVLDYFKITPALALPSLGLLGIGWWRQRQYQDSVWPTILWAFWLLGLMVSFAAVTWFRQDYTAPFAQSRALFWVAGVYIGSQIFQKNGVRNQLASEPMLLIATLLLGISWCAAISWGYSLPILFATPWVWATMECSDRLKPIPHVDIRVFRLLLLVLSLLTFRLGFEFIYRDGNRREMTVHMGSIFTQLTGIYSDTTTAALYLELKSMAATYGPNIAVLPAFPQANYLTSTAPPLPLDWVVKRETNGDNALIYNSLEEKRPVVLIEKNYHEKWNTDPELAVTRAIFENGTLLEETRFFIVKQYSRTSKNEH